MTSQWLVPFVAFTVAGVVATGFVKWAEFREKREKAQQEWRAQVVNLLRIAPRDGRMPRLSELADDKLGATATRYTMTGNAPYVARPETEKALTQLFERTGPPWPFILLHGHSKAGKSRTLTEITRRHFEHAQVIAPKDGKALAALAQLEPELPLDGLPALIWLDDIIADDLGECTDAVLDTLLSRALIVGTSTTGRYHDIQRTGTEATAIAKAALQRANCRELPFELTDDERSQAEQLYPDEQFDQSIGETLVGGEALCAKLRAGRDGNPAGQAIVHAAIDCLRAGIRRPVPETMLRHLFPLYLQQVRINLEPTTDQFTQGLAWAAEPLTSHVALMGKAEDTDVPSWEVLDYVVTADDGELGHPARAIPPFIWDELLATAADQAGNVGLSAYEKGHAETAKKAFELAKKTPDDVAMAFTLLGNIFLDEGDVPAARKAYQQATTIDDPSWSGHALLRLAKLYRDEGDTDAARKAYQQATNTDDPISSAYALLRLGDLYREESETDSARKAFQIAIDSSVDQVASRAAAALESMETEEAIDPP